MKEKKTKGFKFTGWVKAYNNINHIGYIVHYLSDKKSEYIAIKKCPTPKNN